MKLKLDECVVSSAAGRLRSLGYDADNVLEENLQGSIDEHIWQVAQREQRMVVSCDEDMVELWRRSSVSTWGLFYIRLKNQREMADQLAAWFADPAEVARWKDCFVIASQSKLRIRTR